MQTAALILGDQLFSPKLVPFLSESLIFMAEDRGLCLHYRYHRKKIAFFLSSMRSYRDELRALGFKVTYYSLDDDEQFSLPFLTKLKSFIADNKVTKLNLFEVDDKFFEKGLIDLSRDLGVELVIHPTPKFLVSRSDFKKYLASVKKPFMKTFYEKLRRERKILVYEDGSPHGGKWSFDTENRKALPANIKLPEYPAPPILDEKLARQVNELFSDHPGTIEPFVYPTSRSAARHWLKDFLRYRLSEFGPYEDAISTRGDFLFHSVLSPLLNIGWLTPREVLIMVLSTYTENKPSLASVEGFVRQVLGWREFVNGIYRNYSEKQETSNFFNHHGRLKDCWYKGETGIPILDDTIKKADRLAYCHHIERLMVLSNFMLLCEVSPNESHRWFMEMFIDSADWVMGPNVYGMGQHSDGGIFTTKPYFCGSNYLRKMSSYPKGEWCEITDALYWDFVRKKRDFLGKNPRLGMMTRTLDRFSGDKKEKFERVAADFRSRVTTH